MPKAVTIIRADLTATGLRQAAAGSNDANAARRVLGLALVLEGYARGEAARLCGMDRQTLRDWVIRYNAEGVAGLSDRTSPGPKPRLTPEQEAAVAEPVRHSAPVAIPHGLASSRESFGPASTSCAELVAATGDLLSARA